MTRPLIGLSLLLGATGLTYFGGWPIVGLALIIAFVGGHVAGQG